MTQERPSLFDIQELVNLVVDEVAARWDGPGLSLYSNRDSLGACALVSKAFHFRTIRHIFSTISFNESFNGRPKDINHRVEELCSIMEGNPDISSQIRSLSLTVFGDPDQLLTGEEFSCVLHSPKLPIVLAKSIRLEEFALINKLGMLDYLALTPSLSIALGQLCGISSMRKLVFCRIINFPSQLLSSCSSIEDLYLRSIVNTLPKAVCGPKEEVLPTEWTLPVKLKHTTVFDSSSLLQAFLDDKRFSPSRAIFSYLTSIRLHIGTSDTRPLWQLVKQASKTLETLELQEIDASGYLEGDQQHLSLFDLSILPALRTLRVGFNEIFTFNSVWIPIALKNLLSGRSGEPMTIQTVVAELRPGARPLEGKEGGWWCPFEHLMALPCGLPSLRTFKINLHHQHHNPLELRQRREADVKRYNARTVPRVRRNLPLVDFAMVIS